MWYSIAAIVPSGLLHSMRFPVELNTGVSEFSGFVAENYGGSSELKRTLMAGAADVLLLRGNNKLYLVEDWLNLMGWDKVCHRPRRRHAPAALTAAVPQAGTHRVPATALTTTAPPPPPSPPRPSPQVSYQKLFLLGSILSFTVDLSGVGCDCNAAVYLVQMDTPGQDSANYCDIQASH